MFRLWFLKRESEFSFTSSYESVYLKAESSNKNRIRMPGGQVKHNLICLIGKKGDYFRPVSLWLVVFVGLFFVLFDFCFRYGREP